jgi:sugar porter (SP) family MFS transporter
MLGMGIHLFPYSPRWLALVNRRQDCLISLTKLRNLPSTDERVQAEYHGIIAEIEFQRLVKERKYPGVKGWKLELYSWVDLLRKRNWRRTSVGVGVTFFQQFSGINAFIYYAPTLFQSLGQSIEMSLIMSGVFNILQLVGVFICIATIDKVGRRPLAIFGGFGCATCYIIIAILSALYSHDWPAHLEAGWACVAFAFCFILVFGVSYSPLGWALPSEVFTTSTRSKGVALSTCVNWLANFVVGVATPPLMETQGYRTYVFFTVWCFLAGVWALLLVPETKGKTLEEMDEKFGDLHGREESQLMRTAVASARQDTVTLERDV